MFKSNTVFLLFVFISSTHAQNIVLKGKVQDSLQIPLSHANLLAFPKDPKFDMRFAITDEKGEYHLELRKDIVYKVEVSYIGFHKRSFSVQLDKDTKKDIGLKHATTQLDMVEVVYKMPVTVKEDTVTYSVEAFSNGKERKLRELLKKLPGIEVDRKGNVSQNGKRVKKVQVENKDFFTGDPKLAVNYIPADVVAEIELIDDFSEIAMLKPFEMSGKTIMNIKLRKNKKQFAFGELELQGGFKQQYKIHPNLFYYSPKTTVNALGDFNNTGEITFNYKDFQNFEGNESAVLSSDNLRISSGRVAYDLTKGKDQQSRKQDFTALNFYRDLGSKTDISSYFIHSTIQTNSFTQTKIDYINRFPTFEEKRNASGQQRVPISLGRLALEYEDDGNTHFKAQSFFKKTHTSHANKLESYSPSSTTIFDMAGNTNSLLVDQLLSYSKKLGRRNYLFAELLYNFSETKKKMYWYSDTAPQNMLLLVDESPFKIHFNEKRQKHTMHLLLKNYWAINARNHLYFSLGFEVDNTTLLNQNEQETAEGQLESYATSLGYGNSALRLLFANKAGLEYKILLGNFVIRPALYWQSFLQYIELEENTHTRSFYLWLPELQAQVELHNKDKMQLNYKRSTNTAPTDYLLPGTVFKSFNKSFVGNPLLNNEVFNHFSFFYSKRKFARGLLYNLYVDYRQKSKHYKTQSVVSGIYSSDTPLWFEEPENSWYIRSSFSKRKRGIRYRISGSYRWANSYSLIDDAQFENRSRALVVSPSIKLSSKRFPEMELGHTSRFRWYNDTYYQQFDSYIDLDYVFLKDWRIQMYCALQQYKGNMQHSTFYDLEASLSYQKEDSPWRLEITGKNLYNIRYKQKNDFNVRRILDQKDYVLPRMLLFSVMYKM